MQKKEILVVGGTITRNLDRFVENYNITDLNSIHDYEFRFYSLCKLLIDNSFNVSLAVSKTSNSSFCDLEVPVHTYKKKLWVDELEKIGKDYPLVIFTDSNFYGLPTLLYTHRKVIVDLWSTNIARPKVKKGQFFYDFLTDPMIREIQKKATAILCIADLQRVLFPNKPVFKVNFHSFEKEIKRNSNMLILDDERNYTEKLNQRFKTTSFFESCNLGIAFNRNCLFYNWKLSTLINYGIPIIADRRNIVIKELKRSGLAFGCDTTNLGAIIKTIKKVEGKTLKKKKEIPYDSNFINHIKKIL